MMWYTILIDRRISIQAIDHQPVSAVVKEEEDESIVMCETDWMS